MSLLPQGFEYFADAGKFMVLPDGRMAYRTDQRTWVDVLLHSLPLDDYLLSQCVKPNPCQFEWKVYKKRESSEKEGLNDGNKCHMCKDEMKTVIFRTTRKQGKIAICQVCSNDFSRTESLEMCSCCGELQECKPIVESWCTGKTVPMCCDCSRVECCQSCGVWSDGLCSGCRSDGW
jgi:hypothetical protein